MLRKEKNSQMPKYYLIMKMVVLSRFLNITLEACLILVKPISLNLNLKRAI